MSVSELRKLPTDWLDYDDRKAAEKIAAEADRQLSVGSNTANEWEVIGISSGDVSPPLPGDLINQNSSGMSRTGSRRNNPTAASMMTGQEGSRKGGILLKLCGVSHRIFAPIGFSDIGTGRFVGTRLLLVIRLLFLFMHGISGGFSYALRGDISVKFLLSEMFLWLHLSFLFLLPSLLLSSILKIRWNLLRDSQEEEEPATEGQRAWLSVEIVYQVVMVLAQTELARLLVMHSVPALRPIVDHEGAELVYSLTNPFAVQRYLIVASTLIDAVLSTVPLRSENGIPALLVFILWTSVSLFSRPTTGTTAVKIGYLCGFSLMVVALTFFNILIYRVLSSCSHRRKEGNDRIPKTTLDIV